MFRSLNNHRGLLVVAGVLGVGWGVAVQSSHVGDDHVPDAPSAQVASSGSNYETNLALIQSASVRNTNHDASAYRDTPMADVDFDALLGPRSDYLDPTLNPPEGAFPVWEGGQFRTSCEFSHFAYDDPIVHPNQPGAAHLHMFWGNTDVNAYSTYESLRDSGSSTCNGQELNRTGYWAPAMFDADGGVRIPERIIVYYKGYGHARDHAQVYPEGAAMIAEDVHTVPMADGGLLGAPDQFSYNCSNQYRGDRTPAANTIPTCVGLADENPWTELDPHRTLEMHVKFPNCWNGDDPSDPDNWVRPTYGTWFSSDCGTNAIVPNIEYIISYPVAEGESTDGWYLASDVDPTTHTRSTVGNGGQSVHADWWGAWHPTAIDMWVENCATYYVVDAPSGCGFGYLTDGGPDAANPLPGPALKYRPDYVGPMSVPIETLAPELCPTTPTIATAEAGAYCNPHGGHNHSTTTTTTTGTTTPDTTTSTTTVPGVTTSTTSTTSTTTTVPGTSTGTTTTTSVPSGEMSTFDEPASGHEPAQRFPG